jgi:hypothetical protein
MKKKYLLLIGMLLFSCVAVNITFSITADDPHGTRNPGADVEVTVLTENQTGEPTQTLSYRFEVNNTGDEIDSYEIFVTSSNGWDYEQSENNVGPLVANESVVVTVNTTIPIGTPAGSWDNLTLRARSAADFGKSDQVAVTTNVSAAFLLSIDIDGLYSRIGIIDEEGKANYTLTIRNKGNVNVTITLQHSPPSLPNWQVTFPDYLNRKVAVAEANQTGESVIEVNLTITAPSDAQPNDMMTITLWGDRIDISPEWYSWQSQENITLTTTVEPVLGVSFEVENVEGFVDIGDTLYNFTIMNSGNKEVFVNLVVETNLLLITEIDVTHMTLEVGALPVDDTLRVSTAKNTPQGNYTVNLTARMDNATGLLLGYIELYFIVVPKLNITEISVSEKEPMQYKPITLSAEIENIGYIDAKNMTVKFYDGSKKIGEKILENITITTGESTVAEIKWSPSDFGNRTIRVAVDVERLGGEGDYSLHNTDISEKDANIEVEINWQPYYLVIYIIIAVILGFATISSMFELRFYGGRPVAADYGEGEEDLPYEEYPEEEGYPEMTEGEHERPFDTSGITTGFEEREEEPPLYDRPREIPPVIPAYERRAPIEKEFVPPKDPETLRKENELKDELAKVQDKLDKTKSMGVDTNNISQLLSTAKTSLADGDHHKAKQYLGYANDRLENLMGKRDEALKAIKEAKEILSGMRGTADLTIVENFLVKADSFLSEGNYREAINYANKAKDRAARLQRREMRL